MVTCEHCGGRSANGIPYHKRGCATTLGGWSEAQRKAIDTIISRLESEFQRKLNAEFTEWEYEA